MFLSEKVNMNKFQRFKKGLDDITAVQRLNAQMIGALGASAGLTMATVFMIYTLFTNFDWIRTGYAIATGFFAWMQIVSYLNTRLQVKNLKDMEKLIEGETDGI